MIEKIDVLNKWGEFTSDVIPRDEVHQKGIWHKAVVVFIISSDGKKVLLQQRSNNKKLWPGLWDVTSGGHVLTGEFGLDTAVRETKEELGIAIKKEDLEFIGATTSEVNKGDMQDKHYNEYYVIYEDVDIKDIVLQKEEVQDIKWFSIKELKDKIDNNFDGLTGKEGCWLYLLKYIKVKEELN